MEQKLSQFPVICSAVTFATVAVHLYATSLIPVSILCSHGGTHQQPVLPQLLTVFGHWPELLHSTPASTSSSVLRCPSQPPLPASMPRVKPSSHSSASQHPESSQLPVHLVSCTKFQSKIHPKVLITL